MIADKAVSRIHCALDAEADGLWVRDLGSRNGTFVGGMKVAVARVPAGAAIRIGTTEIAVSYGGAPESEPPPSEPPPSSAAPTPSGAPEAHRSGWLGQSPKTRPRDEHEPAVFGRVRASSAALRAIVERAAELAPTEASILIEGESGTGKKALAQAIHDASGRAEQPFVVVECAGLPNDAEVAETLEAALRSAEGGTLVLDEPSDLPLAVQRELVPPLEARAFRTIVTTQKDLRVLVNQGAFRESLYFRLAGATIRVPPLRRRPDDLVPLLRHFLGPDGGPLSEELLADLERLPWPGNVRELARYAERLRGKDRDRARAIEAAARDAAAGERSSLARDDDEGTSEAPIIDPTTLDAASARARGTPDVERRLPSGFEPWFLTGFKEFRERWIDLGEREYLTRLMQRTQRSSGVASREAGLERTYLYRLIKKHGV